MDSKPVISILRAAVTDARTVIEPEQTLLEAGKIFEACIERATGIKVDVCLLRLLDEDGQPMHNSRLMFHGSADDINKVYTLLKESNVCPVTMRGLPLSSCVALDTVKGIDYVVISSSPILINECALEFEGRQAVELLGEKIVPLGATPQPISAIA